MKYEYDTDAYLKQISDSNSYFNTFLDKQSLAAGILSLAPGEEDTQEPHESDEVYYILSGNGFLQIGKKSYRIKEGQIYFVAKDIPHHFYGNTKNLSVLYFFGSSGS